MDRQDVAKAYLSTAQARASRTGVLAFGAMLALAILWAAQLRDATRLIDALGKIPHNERLVSELHAKHTTISKTTAGRTSPSTPNRRSEFVEDQQNRANEIQEKTTQFSENVKAVGTVTFKLPGFPELTVVDAMAALTWLSFAVGLLYYMAWTRRSILQLYARALRILIVDVKVDPEVVKDVSGPLPFWVAPLPRRDGTFVAASLLRSAAGWDHSERWNYALVLLMHTAGLYIAFSVTYVGIGFSQLNLTDAGRAGLLRNTPFLPLTVGAGLAAAGIIFWWISPAGVPDRLSHEAASADDRRRGRRTFLAAATAATVGAVALILSPPRVVRRLLLRPRYRRWANRSPLDPGFYEVGRLRAVTYVAKRGRPRRLKSVPAARIKTVKADREQILRVEAPAAWRWAQEIAKAGKTTPNEVIRDGMRRTAEVVGTAAAKRMRPTFVWFDLALRPTSGTPDRAMLEAAAMLLETMTTKPQLSAPLRGEIARRQLTARRILEAVST